VNPQSTIPTPPANAPDTKLGIVLRVAFFAGTVIVSVRLITLMLYAVFGALVAGTIGLCTTGLLANLLTMKIFDRRPFSDIGLRTGQASGINLLLGVLFGAGSAALMLVAPLLAGTGHLVKRPDSEFSWAGLVFYLLALWFAATGEEMIFRGYGFQLLVEKLGSYATVLPAAVAFGLTHISNPHATLVGVLNTILWGIILGFAFLRSRDLWLPIGLHFGWNAVLPLFGVNLSGLTIDVTRYVYRWDLLPLWSGGEYGPEGGLLATIFIVALFFVLQRAPVRPQMAAIAKSLNEPV
jgi:uncharacterized protein